MDQKRVIARLMLVVSILNFLMMGQKNNMTNAFFFLDLICASRIEALERQLSQLVSIQPIGSAASQASNALIPVRTPSG